jgi:hypothetical protein
VDLVLCCMNDGSDSSMPRAQNAWSLGSYSEIALFFFLFLPIW